MKEIVPAPPAIVRNDYESVRELFTKNVVPSYGRFELVLSHGAGSYRFRCRGQTLPRPRRRHRGQLPRPRASGHHRGARRTIQKTHPRLQSLFHRTAGPARRRTGEAHRPGQMFFANSGAEANEGLFKLARKFGHDEGRFEILTATNSFHGRTLAGIAATGQDKVKKGFEPMTPGFRHVPYNDLGRGARCDFTRDGGHFDRRHSRRRRRHARDAGISARPARVVRREKICCCSWTACSAAIFAPENSRASSGFWKMFRAAKNFCPTAFRWPSRSAADFPSAHSGCARRIADLLGRARTARLSAARRSPAPSR